MDALEDLSKKLGRLKGATALWKEARKAGINVTKAQTKDFVEGIGQKQVLAQSQPSLGKSATSSIAKEGSRWMTDLVQFRFSQQDEETDEEEEDEGKQRYALLVINVFDRKLKGVTLTDKSADSVLKGMRKILSNLAGAMRGGVLSSDTGREFNNEQFQALLKTSDVAWKSKGNASPNDLAVLDRCIQTIRKDITSRMMEEPGKTWAQVLKASIVSYNTSIHGTMRDAPNDVGEEPILQFLQLSDNAKKYAHNDKLAKKRVARVQEQGAFRRPKKAKAFGRGFEAKFGDKEKLESVNDGTLVKAQGDPRKIDVKSILPVPESTDTRAERTARPGAMDRRRKAKTEDLVSFLRNLIDVGQTKSLRTLGPMLRREMADGVYDATLKSINRNLAGVMELWSRDYELKERGRNYYVKRLR